MSDMNEIHSVSVIIIQQLKNYISAILSMKGMALKLFYTLERERLR